MVAKVRKTTDMAQLQENKKKAAKLVEGSFKSMNDSVMDRLKQRKLKKAIKAQQKEQAPKVDSVDLAPISGQHEDEFDYVNVGGMDESQAELFGLTEAMGDRKLPSSVLTEQLKSKAGTGSQGAPSFALSPQKYKDSGINMMPGGTGMGSSSGDMTSGLLGRGDIDNPDEMNAIEDGDLLGEIDPEILKEMEKR